MIMKKVYLAPTLEIIEFEAEKMMIAASKPGVGGGNVPGGVGGESGLTNKRQPIGGTWDSENWKQVEE